MAPKNLTGSSSSGPADPRPRAQVSYEGEDEFSTMSLDPARREVVRDEERLSPSSPGTRPSLKVDKLKPTNDASGVVGFLRKIFAK